MEPEELKQRERDRIKKYYHESSEYRESKGVKVQCPDCGLSVRTDGMRRHVKSKKHEERAKWWKS